MEERIIIIAACMALLELLFPRVGFIINMIIMLSIAVFVFTVLDISVVDLFPFWR